MPETEVNRRDFVKTATATTVAATAAGALFSPTARAQGANSRLRAAGIGFGGRGKHLVDAVINSPRADLVALCDVDSKILNSRYPEQDKAFRTQDLREILDRNEIDVIVSATPNHWHALLTIWGCQAGKHVYMEKPISHNMHESQTLVKASRKYNKIVQCGFQNRSDTGLRPFYERLHAGEFGAVTEVHGTCHRARNTIGKLDEPLTPPASVNYEMWLGPAEDQPIMRPRFHYDWHWDFNTGNGDVGNQGPHEWDLMAWALNDPKELPQKMRAAGNRFGWDDAGNTPNIMACIGELNGIPLTFEVMDLKGGRSAPYRKGVGVIIKTEKGIFVGGRGGGRYVGHDGKSHRFGRNKSGSQGADGGMAHMENFFDAIFNDDRSNQHSEAAVAANSSSMAHMANISFMLAEEAPVETIESAYSGSTVQRDTLARLRESAFLFCASEHGALPTRSWLLGPELSFDTAAYQFTGNKAAEANVLATRAYRKGFELPVL